MEQGRKTFDDKMVVRKAIEEADIPFTYVSANCFAGIFVGGLSQPGHFLPSRESVVLFGDGNQKGKYILLNIIKVLKLCHKILFKGCPRLCLD